MLSDLNMKGTAVNEAPQRCALVSLRPKRRSKHNPESENTVPEPFLAAASSPSLRRQRMKQSGHPHQRWTASGAFCPTIPKLSAAPILH
jgi:hypothetical protein